MNALWAILIDTSGSMGEPFASSAATSTFSGLTEESAYHTKLEAAKEILLKQLHGLSETDVAIISFSDDAQLVCKGTAEKIKDAHSLINSLTPSGQTNLAAALLFALDNIVISSSYNVISFLVISDGLSNIGNPVQAANKTVQSGFPIRISTILIDPTPEGEQIARAVSIGGDVRAVVSSITLQDAVTDERSAHVAAMERPKEPPPAMAAPHQIAALPLHMTIVVLFGILALSCIAGGIYAIVVNAQSKSELSIFGAYLNTGHVGVAFVGIGVFLMFFTIRAVLRNQLDLAVLPLDDLLAKKKGRSPRRMR